MIHQVTILHELSTLRGYWVCTQITNDFDLLWDRKLIIYSLLIGSLLMEVDDNKYSQ